MACSQPRKMVANAAIDHDIISSLPDEMKEKILTKLPIKDAVQTSILSTKWRYTWASIPEILVKDDDLVSTFDGDGDSSRFVSIVDILLLNHKGPILKFNLLTRHHCPEAFDRWILNLSRNGIDQLIFHLNLPSGTKYKIPSNFLFCNALRHVDLCKCAIKLSQGFEGFKLLRILTLKECSITAADTEKLISSSPRLVRLVLLKFEVERNFRIYAMELRCLVITGNFLDFEVDTPKLATACFASGTRCNTMPSLSLVDEPPPGLPKAFHYLKKMYLLVDLADQKECAFMLLLLQGAINLQYLFLQVKMSENTNSSSFWEKDIGFEHLAMVKIERFKSSGPVLAFVKFILGSAPILRTLTLSEKDTDSKEENLLVFEELLKFQRASAKAEVVFE